MCKIKHILSVIHNTICAAVCFQFTHLSWDDWENIYILCLIIITKPEVWTITHCLGLSHGTILCTACLSIFLWICDMVRLFRGTFVSWCYLPHIWPPVTYMQQYYHATYPTDDGHIAYMFSLVYFSVEVCLVGVVPNSVSTRWDLCVRVYASLTLASPSKRKKIEQGVTRLFIKPSEVIFELTYGSACIIAYTFRENREFVFIVIVQLMMSANSPITFGLQNVFVCLYIKPSQYHHCANFSEDIELIK